MNYIPKIWIELIEDKTITTFEDPIFGGFVEKDEFTTQYGQLLETFDGTDMLSHLDMFFERSPTHHNHLIFVDDDAKLDFRDMSIEMGLMDDLKEILEGELKKEKEKRLKIEKKPQNSQKPKKSLNKALNKEEKEELIKKQKLISLEKLKIKLKTTNDEKSIINITTKIQKIKKTIF